MTGFIRFQKPELAAKELEEFLAKPEAERTMAGTQATWRNLEGNEEEEYYGRVSKHGEFNLCFVSITY